MCRGHRAYRCRRLGRVPETCTVSCRTIAKATGVEWRSINPLYAEIVGFCHRDDRYLSDRVRDVTMGIVVREGQNQWRGLVFRPGEDLEAELEPDDDE